MPNSQTNQLLNGVVTKLSPRSVSDTVSRLLDTVNQKGMKLFAVIDQSAEAQNVGLHLRETVLVVFGSPLAGTPVMQESPLAALDLPLKVLVWSDSGQTKVSYLSPEQLVARYQLSEDVRHNLMGIVPLIESLIAQ